MNPFQKWLLLGSSAATALTGIVYGWMKYLLEPTEPWAVINHPLEPWMLKAHILVAPIMVFAVGLITIQHIWKHYRARVRSRRRTGLSMMWLLVPMVASGYLIQAVTSAGWLTSLVVAHLFTGGAYVVALAGHWILGYKRSSPKRRPPLRAETAAGAVPAEAARPATRP